MYIALSCVFLITALFAVLLSDMENKLEYAILLGSLMASQVIVIAIAIGLTEEYLTIQHNKQMAELVKDFNERFKTLSEKLNFENDEYFL
jgi:hypothetical protein